MTTNFIRSRIVPCALFYTALLLGWQVLVVLRIGPSYIFPSPLNVALSLAEGFRDRSFWFGILVSFRRLLTGFSLAIAVGGVLGALLLKSRTFEKTAGSLILGLQTLPSICWFPLALVWFGLSEGSIIFVVVMGSVFSFTMTIHAGLKNIPPIYVNIGRNMGVRGPALLWDVFIPAALPSLLLGLRQSWAFAWRSLLAGELLFNSQGLGFLLNMGRELNDINRVVAVMLVIMAIGVFIDKLVFGRMELAVRTRYGLKPS
ncbi:MAG: ABC transporter permease [Candidatus Omnitrophica bacterium]|nr:ABC transporter permease [Candidatus Omnitrophota bacterium]MDD5575028.1 ABC transporter permease [Candidatus Omnitrophota bacterium]